MHALQAWVHRHCLSRWHEAPQRWVPLVADGSDRLFFRVEAGGQSLLALCHPGGRGSGENDAFVAIGRHLRHRGMPVPAIYAYMRKKGWILLEDLGDLSLQQAVSSAADREEILALYAPVLDVLVDFQVRAAAGFETSWCYQGSQYDERLMLEGESGYFLRAFLRGYLRWPGPDEPLLAEFRELARKAAKFPISSLIHRDFQSRNILLPTLTNPHLIDFQGARWGPPQYDVAALVIDPYVSLPPPMREAVLSAYLDRLEASRFMAPEVFMRYYPIIALHRNLQILAAFAFLGHQKRRPLFLQWVPRAISQLCLLLEEHSEWNCPRLREAAWEAREAGAPGGARARRHP